LKIEVIGDLWDKSILQTGQKEAGGGNILQDMLGKVRPRKKVVMQSAA
jgi:hypothetical protein